MVRLKQKNICERFTTKGILSFLILFVVFFVYTPITFAVSYVIPPSTAELFNTSQLLLKMPNDDQTLETANTLQTLNISGPFPILHVSNFSNFYDKDILQPISKIKTVVKTSTVSFFNAYTSYVVRPIAIFKNRTILAISNTIISKKNSISLAYNNYFSPQKICVDGECLTKDDIHALIILAHATSNTSSALATPVATQ